MSYWAWKSVQNWVIYVLARVEKDTGILASGTLGIFLQPWRLDFLFRKVIRTLLVLESFFHSNWLGFIIVAISFFYSWATFSRLEHRVHLLQAGPQHQVHLHEHLLHQLLLQAGLCNRVLLTTGFLSTATWLGSSWPPTSWPSLPASTKLDLVSSFSNRFLDTFLYKFASGNKFLFFTTASSCRNYKASIFNSNPQSTFTYRFTQISSPCSLNSNGIYFNLLEHHLLVWNWFLFNNLQHFIIAVLRTFHHLNWLEIEVSRAVSTEFFKDFHSIQDGCQLWQRAQLVWTAILELAPPQTTPG